MKEYVRNAIPAIYPAMLFGPNKDRGADARALLREIRQETGGLSMKEWLFCLATIPLSAWTWLAAKLNISQQPKLLRIQHPATPAWRDVGKAVELKASSPATFPGTGSTSPLCSCADELENTR
jgi:hypothetical protein